jgi:hypothetical protein
MIRLATIAQKGSKAKTHLFSSDVLGFLRRKGWEMSRNILVAFPARKMLQSVSSR